MEGPYPSTGLLDIMIWASCGRQRKLLLLESVRFDLESWWCVCYGKLTQHLTVAWVAYVNDKDTDIILVMPSKRAKG